MFKHNFYKTKTARPQQKAIATILLLMLTATAWATPPEPRREDFVGEYILQGKCPHAGQDDYLHSSLDLQKDGQFRWRFESIFYTAYGYWAIKEGNINLIGSLQPEAPVYTQRLDTKNFLKIEADEDEWIILTEPGIVVQFYSKGKNLGSLATDKQGLAILDLKPDYPYIDRITLKRENTKDKPQAFDLDSQSIKNRVALFRVAPLGASRILMPDTTVKILEREGPNDPSLELREPVYMTDLLYYRKDVPPCKE